MIDIRIEDFNEEKRKVLELLAEKSELEYVNINDDSVEIFLEGYNAYTLSIVLKGVTKCSLKEEMWLIDSNIVYLQDESCYSYNGIFIREGEEAPFDVYFNDVDVIMEVFDCTKEATYAGDIWEIIRQSSRSICDKADISKKFINNKEEVLIPLIKEIDNLQFAIYRVYAEEIRRNFPNLKELSEKYGYKELVKLFERIDECCIDNSKRSKRKYTATANMILNEMNLSKYAALWYDIWEKIKDSQKDYPSKIDIKCPAQEIQRVHQTITEKLRANGYEGEYPDFVKVGDIKKVHLVNSYGISYFTGLRKDIKFFIHCGEIEVEGKLYIEFVCGTDLRKNDSGSNIYDCMFNTKGRTNFVAMIPYFGYIENETDDNNLGLEDMELQSLNNDIELAMRISEYKKLTKKEKDRVYGWALGISAFLTCFILMGGLFAMMFIPAMMLFCAVMVLPVGGIQAMLDVTIGMPWMWIGGFAFCWIGFGTSMGIIEVLARRGRYF